MPLPKVKKIVQLHKRGQAGTEEYIAVGRRKNGTQLTEEQLAFLTAEQTLETWRMHGLRARCSLFRQHFPTQKLSVATLRAAYWRARVGYRVLKRGMTYSARQLRQQRDCKLRAFPELLDLAAR